MCDGGTEDLPAVAHLDVRVALCSGGGVAVGSGGGVSAALQRVQVAAPDDADAEAAAGTADLGAYGQGWECGTGLTGRGNA